jgi:DNA-binding SARP family transcriptional activator/streptogramin lyase
VSTGVEFRLLGPIELVVDGVPVDLGGAKQRALLALLMLHPDRPVTIAGLTDELWRDAPTAAAKNIQVHVSRIRRALGVHADLLATTSAGYVLHVSPGETDLQQFEQLFAAARDTMSTDPATAAASLRRALRLWRGTALADLAGEPVAQAVAHGLDERRLAALEARITAELVLGRHQELVAELVDLVARHPLREQLRAQLMLALYRSGRQADALASYTALRTTLTDELGIEPSPQLQSLQGQILRQDPELDHVSAALDLDAQPSPSMPTTPSRRPSRRMLTVLGATVALGVAAAVALIAGAHDSSAGVVRSDSVAILDRSGAVVADVRVGSQPGPITVAGGAVWVGDVADRTLDRIDPRSRAVVKTLGLTAHPASLAAGQDVVWLGNGFDGTLTRVLTTSDQLSAPFFPSGQVAGLVALTADDNDLWAGLADGSLLRLDPTNLRVRVSTRIPGRPRILANGPTAVWSVQFNDAAVRRVDPTSGHSTVTTTLGGRPTALAVGDGSVWVSTAGDGRLWRLSGSTGEVEASVPLGGAATAIAVTTGAVWVAVGDDGEQLVRVDPRTTSVVQTHRLGHPIAGLTVVDGQLWATVD